jgi:RecB family exonuclease
VPSPFLDEATLGAVARRRVTAAVVPSARAATSTRQLLARAARLGRGAAPAVDEPPPGALLAAVAEHAALGPRLAAALAVGRAPVGRLTDERARRAVADLLAARAAPSSADAAWLTSASALEQYAACPFKFFASHLLGLPEPSPADDDLDAREGGTLLHAVARDVFAALQQAELLPLAGGARAPRERAVALDACDASLDAWEARGRTGPGALWSLRRELALAQVARLVEVEARRRSPLAPAALEAAFGGPDDPPLRLPSPDGARAIVVRGRVDRVDAGAGRAEVIDYKSGRVDDKLDAAQLGRTQFQLAIYAAWARQRLGAADVDAWLCSLRDGSRSTTLVEACARSERTPDALLALDTATRARDREGRAVEAAAGAAELPERGYPSLADTAWALLGGLEAGRFDVHPDEKTKVCSWCAYATCCRVEGKS